MTRVLVVEDDALFRRFLRRILEREGLEVVEAPSLGEAIDRLGEAAYDLVVTDYALGPSETGAGFLEHLGRTRPGCPAILISGHSAEMLEEVARRHGVFAFLRKPFEPGSFLDACADALRSGGEGGRTEGRGLDPGGIDPA